jgi:CheY-like chemotaxis protein
VVAHACLPRASGKRGSLPEQGEPETGLADILIVDDERSIRAALAEILGYKGYVSESAADGHEAIGRVMDLKFRGREYRMILMDLKLKPELDGARTARFLDEASPEFRTRSSLSYISAFLSSVDMDRSGTISEKGAFRLAHRFENLRFIRTLNKPVDMEDLLELVSEGIGAYDMASLIKGGGGTVSP